MTLRAPMVALATLLLAPALAGSRPPARSTDPAPVESIAEAKHDLALGFTIRGRVHEVLAKPGDRVEAGQPLIRLDARETEAALRLAAIRAESDLETQAAEAAWKLAENEEGRVREAVKKGGAATFELERATLEATRARLSHELSLQRRAELELQREQARLLHERFTLAAPMAGVVEEIRVENGEMVDEVRPVLRLVVIDPLWIDAPAPIGLAATLKVGGPAWVSFSGESAAAPLQGRIVHVASVADPGSETRLVRVEVVNSAGRPAGSHVKVSFAPPAQGESAAR